MSTPIRLLSTRLLLAIAVLMVVSLTSWSLLAQPTPTLLAHLPKDGNFELRIADDRPGISWYRLHLRLSPEAEKDPAWRLIDGDARSGYQLQWWPKQHTWRLVRLAPGPKLLAEGRLEAAPKQIEWVRHGQNHFVHIDGVSTPSILDLMPLPAARRWTFEQEYPAGKANLEIHDEGYLAPHRQDPDDIDTADNSFQATLNRLRSSVADLATSTDGPHPELIKRVVATINEYAIDGGENVAYNEAQLWAWWTWAFGLAVANNRNGFDRSAMESVLSHLRILANRKPAPPPLAGLMMDIAEHLSSQAALLPSDPEDAVVFAGRRRALLTSVAAICEDLIGSDVAGPVTGLAPIESERFTILLLNQAARILAGREPLPTPAEAPAWMSQRSRALGATLPIETPLPKLPEHWHLQPWVRGSLNELLKLAQLEPIEAVETRAALLNLDADASTESIDAILAREGLPTRTRLLCLGILSAAGLQPAQKGLDALTEGHAAGNSLAQVDPLAYAVYRLILRRQSQALGPAAHILGFKLPPGLTPHERLLSGGHTATTVAFGVPGTTLPPPELVAAALAMQEITGLYPDWSLVKRLPSFTLPLELLLPRSRPASPFEP